jgi:hypothetical protein
MLIEKIQNHFLSDCKKKDKLISGQNTKTISKNKDSQDNYQYSLPGNISNIIVED